MKRFFFWVGVFTVAFLFTSVVMTLWNEHRQQKIAQATQQEADAVNLAFQECQAKIASSAGKALPSPTVCDDLPTKS